MSERDAVDRLDAVVAALSAHGPIDPGDAGAIEELREEIDRALRASTDGAALVARYGADARAALVRPLSFSLAVSINDEARAKTLAPAVVKMICGLACDDSWARVNLCTALQRLLMFGALGSALEGGRDAAVAAFLRDALDGPPLLRSTAAAVVADMTYRARSGALSCALLDPLCEKVISFEDDEDELARGEARGLREHLEQHPAA